MSKCIPLSIESPGRPGRSMAAPRTCRGPQATSAHNVRAVRPHRVLKGLVVAAALLLLFCSPAASQQTPSPDSTEQPGASERLKITEAMVCERVIGGAPYNRAAVFSVSNNEVYFFTRFDDMPEEMVIYHQWYHRDSLAIQMRLKLRPPSWATYSSIGLRDSDIGPWRVEVTDTRNNVLKVLRFSVTD